MKSLRFNFEWAFVTLSKCVCVVAGCLQFLLFASTADFSRLCAKRMNEIVRGRDRTHCESYRSDIVLAMQSIGNEISSAAFARCAWYIGQKSIVHHRHITEWMQWMNWFARKVAIIDSISERGQFSRINFIWALPIDGTWARARCKYSLLANVICLLLYRWRWLLSTRGYPPNALFSLPFFALVAGIRAVRRTVFFFRSAHCGSISIAIYHFPALKQLKAISNLIYS